MICEDLRLRYVADRIVPPTWRCSAELQLAAPPTGVLSVAPADETGVLGRAAKALLAALCRTLTTMFKPLKGAHGCCSGAGVCNPTACIAQPDQKTVWCFSFAPHFAAREKAKILNRACS